MFCGCNGRRFDGPPKAYHNSTAIGYNPRADEEIEIFVRPRHTSWMTGMDFKPPHILLGPQPLLGEQTTTSLLQDAVGAFRSNRVQAISAIRRLQTSDPAGLALAAVRLLEAAEEKSPWLEGAAGLLTGAGLLARLFLGKRLLALEGADPLAL